MPRAAGKRPARWRVNVNPSPDMPEGRIFGSEWVPGRARGKFQIADIGARAQADAGADRYQHDVIGGERGHAEAADDVGGAVDADEALVDRTGRREVVDQRHG